MPTHAARQLPSLTADLVCVHRKLAEYLVAAAEPIVERQTEARRRTLTVRRDELFRDLGHLGLAWMRAGGTVELVDGTTLASTPKQAQAQQGMNLFVHEVQPPVSR